MNSKSVENLRIIYVLYLIGAFVGAIMFVGVILAYMERGKITDSIAMSHVEKQIRTFWVWLILLVVFYIGLIMTFVPSWISFATGDGTLFAFSRLFFLVILCSLFPLGVFLYVLITSILSLRRLDQGEPIYRK